jgi:hypothetical protein
MGQIVGSAECPGCEDQCCETVYKIGEAPGERYFILCSRRDDTNRVYVDRENVEFIRAGGLPQ